MRIYQLDSHVLCSFPQLFVLPLGVDRQQVGILKIIISYKTKKNI